MNKYNLDFLKDELDTGLLKKKRVGMIRRTLKRIDGEDFKELRYLPLIKGFIVLNVKGRFEK